MRKIIKHIISMIALTTILTGVCWAIVITLTGNFPLTIDATDMIGPQGGNDLVSPQESASNVATINITVKGTKQWQVNVRKSDTVWLSSLHLYVRRTGNGTGKGSIQGGTTYQEITGTSQYFFNGNSSRTDITIQLKIEGVSAQILNVTPYSTTVIYNAIEL